MPPDKNRSSMFLALELAEILRIRRFGRVRSYEPGEAVFRVGEVGHGILVILSGEVDLIRAISKPGALKNFLTQGPGAVALGEMAQLAGHPTLVDGPRAGTG